MSKRILRPHTMFPSTGSKAKTVERVGPGRAPGVGYESRFEEGLYRIIDVETFVVDEDYLKKAPPGFWGRVGGLFHRVTWEFVRR